MESRIVIVEGVSDKVALETLVARYGRDLGAGGITVVPIGGAHAMGRFVAGLRAQQPNVKLAGLYDVGEETSVQEALERAGFGSSLTRHDLGRLGFYACDRDLEDELIRALSATRVQQVLEANGELKSFVKFQRQPAQRGRSVEQQLHRFMGTHSGRKAKYARALIDALDLAAVPRPLESLLAYLWPDPARGGG